MQACQLCGDLQQHQACERRERCINITVAVNKTAKIGKELVNNATVSRATYDPMLTNNRVVQKTMVSK